MSFLFGDTAQYGAATLSANDLGYDVPAQIGTYTATGGPFNERYSSSNINTRSLGVNAGTLTMGRWVRRTTTGLQTLWQWKDSGSVQCSLRWNASNQLIVVNGATGTTLGTSSNTLSTDVWYFVEWEVTFGNTGSTKVWVDGTQVINVSSVDTTTTANNFANQWGSVAGVTTVHEGALYILDSAGSAPWNTRYGPVKGQLYTANADGNYASQFTANGAASRFQCVDETPTPNDDTDYISSNTAGHKNSVTLTNTSAIGAILGVMHYFRERRDDAGPHTIRAFLRIGGTDYVEATETSPASYIGHAYMREKSPATTAQWTSSEIDGMEHGVELVS